MNYVPKNKRFKHGKSNTKIYHVWQNIEKRHRSKRWKKFENFYDDMGEKPKGKGVILEKINNKFLYSKKNCRWETRRKIKEWSPNNMNDGFINRGRFFVYFPSHRRAINGYIERAIINYEYYNNNKVLGKFIIHHKNRNRLDDSKENLEKMNNIVHLNLHNPKTKTAICSYCKKIFYNNHQKIKFCCKEHYYLAGRKEYTCLYCRKKFIGLKSIKRKCCSGKCASYRHKLFWEEKRKKNQKRS